MKNFAMLLVVGVMTGGATTSFAGQVRMDHPGDGFRNSSFAGGAFRATSLNGYNGEAGGYGGTANSFLTFCIERSENVTLGNTYHTTMGTVARDGGISGGNPDPLSPVTAALYQEYRNAGSFGGLALLGNGLLDTANEGRSMQRAIWHSEGELDGSEYTNDALAVALYNWAVANNDGTLGNVRVLNLWANAAHTQFAQDQLTLIPLPPAAWAGLSALGGVFGMRYVRRRSHCA